MLYNNILSIINQKDFPHIINREISDSYFLYILPTFEYNAKNIGKKLDYLIEEKNNDNAKFVQRKIGTSKAVKMILKVIIAPNNFIIKNNKKYYIKHREYGIVFHKIFPEINKNLEGIIFKRSPIEVYSYGTPDYISIEKIDKKYLIQIYELKVTSCKNIYDTTCRKILLRGVLQSSVYNLIAESNCIYNSMDCDVKTNLIIISGNKKDLLNASKKLEKIQYYSKKINIKWIFEQYDLKIHNISINLSNYLKNNFRTIVGYIAINEY